MRVLLLNPPGERMYIRDYFCSKTTKSNYLFHPIDLVMLSGRLAERHETAVLDCMAERLAPRAAREKIDTLSPDAIVALVGSVSWDEDRRFLAAQAALGRRVLAIGDVLQEDSEARLAEEPWLEAALHDFSSEDALHCLEGRAAEVQDATVRDAGAIRRARQRSRGPWLTPRPRHELFPARGYRFSFARSRRFATVLSEYGCPYPCTFCVIGTLGFRSRPIGGVLEEIDHLRARGIRELFLADQTFGLREERGIELCDALASRDLSWTTFTRPDTASDALLSAMRRAGCHTVILGVESADDEQLARYRKGYSSAEVRDAVRRAKRHGLRTVGTFIVGLPEDDRETLERTLGFAIELDLDFMSLNMAVPRFSTPFRARAVELGIADPRELVMDQGGAQAFLPTRSFDRAAMLSLKKRMVRRFYLRPGYLWRRARSVSGLRELRSQAREGLALLLRNV